MKALKTILAAAVILAGAVSAKADAVFRLDTFNDNTSLGLVRDNLGNAAGGTFLGQIYGSFTSTNPNDFVALGTAVAFGTGGPGYLFSNTAINVTGANSGQTLNYVLKAWNSAAGSSFEQALANSSAIVGVSGQASLQLADNFNPGQWNSSNGFASFQLAAVPEPTTVALGVLGGLGLLARRRRNAKV